MPKFYELLNAAIQQSGYNNAQLAALMGVTPATIGNWRNGVNEPASAIRHFGLRALLGNFDQRMHIHLRAAREVLGTRVIGDRPRRPVRSKPSDHYQHRKYSGP
ncbi:MAG: helix-turn-helix transcriptional regulator [Rhodospirillales bacterium]|nr:helix-turn-helix transcriptional regulator [Rhodospirillales bacterium]